MGDHRRPGWPALVVLVSFFFVCAFLVFRPRPDVCAPTSGSSPSTSSPTDAAAPTWRHHAWRDARTGAPDSRAAYDPQRWVSERGSSDAGAFFEAIARHARVVSSSGRELERGARCDLRVLPLRDEDYDCLVRVVCGRELLYPDPAQTAGYNRCERAADGQVDGVVDPSPSSVDGDPILELSLRSGRLRVADDGPRGFTVTLAVAR